MAETSKNPEVWSKVAMADHFEKIQKLKDKIDGVPNFRRVPGYKVFCCGQPTKEGFVKACEKVCCRFRLLSRCNKNFIFDFSRQNMTSIVS